MPDNKTARLFLVGFILLSTVSFTASAQNNKPSESKTKKERQAERSERINQMIKQEEEGALIYNKQNLFGIKLYSDGWAGLYEKGYMKTVNKTNLFSVEFGERKDHKEEKVAKPVAGGFFLGNPLIYGKQNNFFFLKLGVGQSYLLGGKGNKNGVALSAIYAGGVSVGLLKPYYVDVIDPTTNEVISIKYQGDSSRLDELFINPTALQGGSGLFKGVGETKLKPGLYAKGALRFDYGRYNEFISAIEAGFSAEFYFSGMPMLVNNKARKLFLNVFVALEIGKRK